MRTRKIAIVGSHPVNEPNSVTPSYKNLELAPFAGRAIGYELAEAGYHIDVYSSDEKFFESSVVSGYIMSNKAQAQSIDVHYSTNDPIHENNVPDFLSTYSQEECESYKRLFQLFPDTNSNWEVSFYKSLAHVDGIVLLGGGASTLVAGLIAISQRIPIVAIASFGGKTSTVFEAAIASNYPWSEEDRALMLQVNWGIDDVNNKQLAKELVQVLGTLDKKLKGIKDTAKLNTYAGVALSLTCLAGFILPTAINFPQVANYLYILGILSVGASGGILRPTISQYLGHRPKLMLLANSA